MAIIQCTACGHKFVRSPQRDYCPLCQQPVVPVASVEPHEKFVESLAIDTPLLKEPEGPALQQSDDETIESETSPEIKQAQAYLEQLYGIFDALLAANSWDDVRTLIEKHQQVLLNPSCLPILEILAQNIRANGHADVAEHVDMYRALFLDSIQHGFDPAWTTFLKAQDAVAEALRDLMLAHIQGNVRQVLLAKKDLLLSPIAVASLYRVINRFGSDTTHGNAYNDYLLHLLLDARAGQLPPEEQHFPPIDEAQLSPDGLITLFPGMTGIHPNDPMIKRILQNVSDPDAQARTPAELSAYLDFLVEMVRWTDFPAAGNGEVEVRSEGQQAIQQKAEQLLSYVDRAKQPQFWAMLQNSLSILPLLDPNSNADNASFAEPQFSVEEAPVQWAQALMARSFLGWHELKNEHKRAELLTNLETAFSLLDPVIHPEEWNFALFGRAFTRIHQRTDLSVAVLTQSLADVEQAALFFTRARSLAKWAMVTSLRNEIYLQLVSTTGAAEKYGEMVIEDYSQVIEACHNESSLAPIYYEALISRAQAQTMFAWNQRNQDMASVLADLNIVLHEYDECQSQSDCWATVQETLGTVYYYAPNQDIQSAIACFDQALRVFTPDNNRSHWANTVMLRALAYSSYAEGSVLRNKEKALEDLLLVCDEFTPAVSAIRWAILHANLGNLYLVRLVGERQENFEQAVEHYSQALTILTSKEHTSFWAIALTSRGTAYRHLAMPNVDQIQLYTISPQELLTRLFLPLGQGNIIQDVADLLPRYRKYMQLAIQDFEQALTTLTSEEYPNEWSYARRELIITQSIYDIWRNVTASPAQVCENFEQVLDIYKQRNLRYDWAITLNNRASFYFSQVQNGYLSAAQDALRDISAALTILTPLTFPHEYRNLQALRAHIYYHLQMWEEAHSALLVVRDMLRHALLSAPSGSDLFAEIAEVAVQDFYIYDAQILARLGRYDEALLALEEGRAQNLRLTFALDTITATRTDSSDSAQQRMQAFLSAREIWRKQQQYLNIQIQQASLTPEERDTMTSQLEQTWLELMHCAETIRANDDPEFMHVAPTMQDIERALTGPDEALVYLTSGIIMAGHSGMAFIVSQGLDGKLQLHYLDLPQLSLQAISDLLEPNPDADMAIRLDQALQTLGPAGLNTVVQALREQKALRRIRLIPHGRLGLFPLPAVYVSPLSPQQDDKRTFGDFFEVTLVPSAYAAGLSAIHARSARTEQRQQLLLVGNPQPLPEGYSSLPYAEAEAEIVQHLARKHGDQPQFLHLLVGEQAIKERVVAELQHARYAHLAQHGEYLAYDPLASQLIFAGEDSVPESERTLSLRETLDGRVDLHGLRLVVLSACETSRIDVRRIPDEGLGLATGFLQAGVAGVIASLWRVSDRATYLLMTRFADLYLNPTLHLTPAQALAQAQLWLRQEATYQVLAQYKPQLLNITVQRLSENQQYILTRIRTAAAAEARIHPDSLPYADARYWSAFVVTGR